MTRAISGIVFLAASILRMKRDVRCILAATTVLALVLAGSPRVPASQTSNGGLQFHPLTWLGFGGAEFGRYAHQASKIEQIAIAERVLAIQGPGAWPNCFEPLPFHF